MKDETEKMQVQTREEGREKLLRVVGEQAHEETLRGDGAFADALDTTARGVDLVLCRRRVFGFETLEAKS